MVDLQIQERSTNPGIGCTTYPGIEWLNPRKGSSYSPGIGGSSNPGIGWFYNPGIGLFSNPEME